ncbi:hypothetical protein FW774_03565 (plasmid) [Pedobacter sp. BS3]|nr:hypothetical protein FW774_03565 [Pedobacter sp. BS3]
MVEVLFIATFKFEEELIALKDIPSYFYRNVLGIMFPYVRAFVSMLSFQANMNPIILPLLNLTTLESYFKENTTMVEEV